MKRVIFYSIAVLIIAGLVYLWGRSNVEPEIPQVIALPLNPSYLQWPKMSEKVEKYGLPVEGLGRPDMRVGSGSELDTDEEFIAAYYDAREELLTTLYISRFDKKQKKWQEKKFDKIEGGSVLSIRKYNEGRISLCLHINPSAGTELLVDKDFNIIDLVYGSVIGVFNDTVVYESSEVHFAPTHYLEIYAKEIKKGVKADTDRPWEEKNRGKKIFPISPFGKTREGYIKTVKDAYDKYQTEHPNGGYNHHLNAEWFNCWKRESEVNYDTNSIYLLVNYDAENGCFPEIRYSSEDYSYISCIFTGLDNIDKIRYVEMQRSELENICGKHPVADYLKPEMLKKIFK